MDPDRNSTKSEFVEKINTTLYFILLYPRAHRTFSENVKWVISFHGGSENFWAELDLNQRRHIANEFTVRPH